MRITFLLPALSLHGGVKAVRRIADGLVQRGHDVQLISADAEAPWPPPWRPRTFARRAREAMHDRTNPRGAFLDGSLARLVRLDKDKHTPADVPDADAIVATWWQTAETMRDFPERKGRKFYFVQADETELAGEAFRERVLATYRDPYRHICVSTFLADMIRSFGHDEPALAPVGVDEIFKPLSRQRKYPPIVGVQYSSHPSKGWNDAAPTLRMLRERIPDVIIRTFGSHPVEERHRLDNMSFELRPTQARIAELSSMSDVWLMPSTREGFGLPGVEAAATGTPVVATRSGGPADYVRDGENGFLVDVGDRNGMTSALHNVLTCAPERWHEMSLASTRIAEAFRWPKAVEAFEKALRD